MLTVEALVTERTPLLDVAGAQAALLARAAKERLVGEEPSVTYELLAHARGQREPAARQWVRRLRARGELITVEHRNATLIPSFQFDAEYEPLPRVGACVARLTGAGMDGWAVWRWFSAVSPWTDERPVELVRTGRLDELDALVERFLADSAGE